MKKIYDPLEKLRQNPKSFCADINAMCWCFWGCDSDQNDLKQKCLSKAYK